MARKQFEPTPIGNYQSKVKILQKIKHITTKETHIPNLTRLVGT